MTGPDDLNGDGALAPDALLAVDPEALLRALPSMPDELNAVLRLADGRRTVGEVALASGLGPDAAHAALRRLLATGALRLVEAPEWFAQPADPDRADPADDAPAPAGLLVEPAPEAPEPEPEPARPAVPARAGSMRVWLVGAALLVAAAVVAGVVARRGAGALAGSPSGRPAPGAIASPSPPAAVPAATVADALASARERLVAGDAAAAATSCRRAIELDPSSGPAWTLLGEAHLAAGDPARARAAFERSLAVDPGGPAATAARAALERLRP